MSAQPDPSPPPRSSPWGEGTVVGRRYRLLKPLGAGAMGEVWRAEHMTLGTTVAVKLVDLEAQPDPSEALARFLQEARAAAKLKSPHVVQILDHGASGRVAYITMELLEGECLATRLARERSLAPPALLTLMRGVAVALDKAHREGIVHRDLKPANIFFARGDEGEVVKVLDFGIAKIIGEGKRDAFVQTQVGLVMGTPAYMSPEQVLGRPIDARSDLWQLGVVAFECLCGTLPFQGAAVGEVFLRICSGPIPVPSSIARVPPAFDAWLGRALQRDPRLRFGSALELSAALEQALALGPTPAAAAAISGVHPARRGVPPAGRRVLWIGAAAGVAFASAALAIVAMIGRGSVPTQAAGDPGGEPSAPLAAPSQEPAATPAAATIAAPSATPAAEAPAAEAPANAADAAAPAAETAAPRVAPAAAPHRGTPKPSPVRRAETELGI